LRSLHKESRPIRQQHLIRMLSVANGPALVPISAHYGNGGLRPETHVKASGALVDTQHRERDRPREPLQQSLGAFRCGGQVLALGAAIRIAWLMASRLARIVDLPIGGEPGDALAPDVRT